MEYSAKNFAGKLRKAREDRKLLQKELAAILEVGADLVSFWERGVQVPQIRTLVCICNTLKLSPDYFLSD